MPNLWKAEFGEIPLGADVMKPLLASPRQRGSRDRRTVALGLGHPRRRGVTGEIAHRPPFSPHQRGAHGRRTRRSPSPIASPSPRPSAPSTPGRTSIVTSPYNGYTFLATGPLVQGLKYKGAPASRSTSSRSRSRRGRPISSTARRSWSRCATALSTGRAVQRDRVFLTAPAARVVGGVTLFKGRDFDGRQRRADAGDGDGRERSRDPRLRHAAEPVLADLRPHALRLGLRRDPRDLCGERDGRAPGRRRAMILSGVAAAQHAQGSIVFTSGANANVRATVKSVNVGRGFNLMYPLPFAPCVGDAFTVACWLRSYAGDVSGPVQQSGQFPRLPLRSAAGNGVLTMPRVRECRMTNGPRSTRRSPTSRFAAKRRARRRRRGGALLDRHALPSRGRRQGPQGRRRLRDDPGARLLRSRPRRNIRPAALHARLDAAPRRGTLSRLSARPRARGRRPAGGQAT